MGISRGTLREALRQLEYEGLLEVGERGRLTVRTLTDAEVLDMFAARPAFEGLAASIVSARPDRAAVVARLQAALPDLEAAGGSIDKALANMSAARHRPLSTRSPAATRTPPAPRSRNMREAARTLLITE